MVCNVAVHVQVKLGELPLVSSPRAKANQAQTLAAALRAAAGGV
jgi:hypothetical protein